MQARLLPVYVSGMLSRSTTTIYDFSLQAEPSYWSVYLVSLARGKLLRCVIPIARVSRAHNRNRDNVSETNALRYGGVCVAGQHEQHQVPHEL